MVYSLSHSTTQIDRSRPPSRSMRPQGGQKKKKRVVRSCEIIGQCQHCFDLFTVHLSVYRGHLCVQETARLQWKSLRVFNPLQNHMVWRRSLVHRPGTCDGQVSLYGSPEELSGIFPEFVSE